MGQLLKYGIMVGKNGQDFDEEGLEAEALVRDFVSTVGACPLTTILATNKRAARCPRRK